MRGRHIGWGFLLVLGLVGCAPPPSPATHCEARQKLWERAFPDESSNVKARQIFVDGCTRELSGADKLGELRCREACLQEAPQDAPLGTEIAMDAYQSFTGCEARCLGVEPGPLRVD